MSTVKNSELKAFEWKSKIDEPLLQFVEDNCEKSMEELGYAMGKRDGQTLIKSAIEVWPY